MSATVRVLVDGGREGWFYGSGKLLYPAIRAARSPRRYDQVRRAIAVPRGYVDDVVAALESQNGGDVKVERVTG